MYLYFILQINRNKNGWSVTFVTKAAFFNRVQAIYFVMNGAGEGMKIRNWEIKKLIGESGGSKKGIVGQDYMQRVFEYYVLKEQTEFANDTDFRYRPNIELV